MSQVKQIPEKLSRQFRTLTVVREQPEGDDPNRFAFALSSEEPAEQWFGTEVLKHDAKSIRQDRLKAGIPLLFNHDRDQHMGVVDGYSIKDGKLRVEGRWSSSDFAQEKKRDYADGILKDASVGYLIHKITREQAGEYPSSDDTLYVTDWEPLEASLVTVPADPTVGVGRSAGEHEVSVVVEVHRRAMEVVPTAAPAAISVVPEVRTMAEQVQQPDAGQLEIARRDAIMAIASDKDFSRHVTSAEVREAFEKGTSVADFSQAVSRKIIAANQASDVGTAGTNVVRELGKDAKRYSHMRAQRMAINRVDPTRFSGEDFTLEREVSAEIAKRANITSGNVVMPSTAVRANTATASGTGQTPVGAVIPTFTSPDVIQLLRIQPRVIQLGAQHMGGLNGVLRLPRQTGAGSFYWLTEGSDTTESDITADFLTLSPKRGSIQNQYTVELLAQDAVGIEALLGADREKVIALAIDNAALLPASGNSPNGLLGQSGLATFTSSGATLTNGKALQYSDLTHAEAIVANANADYGTFAWLTTPDVRAQLKSTPMFASGYAMPIWNPQSRSVNGVTEDGPLGYKAAVTNQLPKNYGASTNLQPIIYGDFSQIVVADWGASELIVDPYTQAGKGIYVITERLLMDVQVRQVAPFAVCETVAIS